MTTLAELGAIAKSYYSETDPAEAPQRTNTARRVKGQPRLNRNTAVPESLGYRSASLLNDKQREKVSELADESKHGRFVETRTNWLTGKKTRTRMPERNPMRSWHPNTVSGAQWAMDRSKKYPNKVNWADPKDIPHKGVAAMAFRIGGKNTGRGVVIGNKASLKGKSRAFANETFRHEAAHAAPRRSTWRMARVVNDPERLAREEARAVHSSQGLFGRKRARRFQNVPYDKLAAMNAPLTGFDNKAYLQHRSALDVKAHGKQGMRTKAFMRFAMRGLK